MSNKFIKCRDSKYFRDIFWRDRNVYLFWFSPGTPKRAVSSPSPENRTLPDRFWRPVCAQRGWMMGSLNSCPGIHSSPFGSLSQEGFGLDTPAG